MPQANTETAKPVIFIVFGITGDLSQRKLLPALYHLFHDGLLHPATKIIGLSRRDVSAEDLMQNVELCVIENDKTCDPHTLKLFASNLEMVQFDPTDDAAYQALSGKLEAIDGAHGDCLDRLIYLSIPPNVYEPIVRRLGESKIANGCRHGKAKTALLVEKPFGYDQTSSEELIYKTAEHFDESQVYRIDHYLAKETAQNILTFRRENPLFTDIWDGKHISHIEVIAAEKIGVEGRGGFYDDIGALRDLIQSHLLQLLSLLTLSLPDDTTDESVHTAKQKLLESIEPVPATMVATRVRRGQYEGYRDDVQNPKSNTETFASVELQIQSERWKDTLIHLETGKKMAEKATLARLTFGAPTGAHNILTFRLQPNEGLAVSLQVKRAGLETATDTVDMNFDYQAAHPDAYERVLIDAIRGDHMLFASSGEVRAAWRILQPVLDKWEQNNDDLVTYQPGSASVG